MIAVCCVPIMLFVKPILLYFKHQNDPKPEIKKPLLEKTENELAENEDKPLILVAPAPAHSHGHEEFELSEVFVHQIIETIEFVLGINLIKNLYIIKK